MRSYGRCSISEFLQDRILYRNLNAVDRSLPGLDEIGRRIGLAEGTTPRKNELDYARVVVELLQACRLQDQSVGRIERLVFVGDTRLLDGTAFANLCRVSGWPGFAFIGSENNEPAAAKVVPGEDGSQIFLANRWSAIAEFDQACTQRGMTVGEGTAVVLDMDKTMVGARGRNGQVIDRARMEAVRETAAGLLGDDFDPEAFQAVYEPLNQPEFHPFTGDNQDYLAYICLILGTGLFTYPGLVDSVRGGR